MTGEPPVRRGVIVLSVVAAVAILLLLLGHHAIEGYIEKQREKHGRAEAELTDSAGVSGCVTFAGGAPAASARVSVIWKDAAGRPGSTPALANADGRFTQGNVPASGSVVEVRASVGPLFAKAPLDQLPRGGTSGVRVAIELPREFRLAGLLRRAGDRAPVAGATIEVGGVRATSGADGDFRAERIPAAVLHEGRPVVRITAAGFQPLDWPLPLDALPETYGDLTILMERAK
jgi:hypothetical protein